MKNRVKEMRKLNKISQQELAEMINVSRQTIISIEKGRYVPSTLLGLKLSHFLKTKMEEIFILEDTDINTDAMN